MTDRYTTTPTPPQSSSSYREFARGIRAVAPTWESAEARSELLLLAAHYEKLAGFVDAIASMTTADDVPAEAATVCYELRTGNDTHTSQK